MKQTDANGVDVSKKINARLDKMMQDDYAGIALNIDVVNDKSEYTLESANAVIFDLIIAIVLIAFIMLFSYTA